jgi:heme-degrading monooxygenase HmoA
MEDAMIVRSWRAHATRENAPLYAEHALSQVFPAIAKIAGHQGALVLRRDHDANVEIVVLTFWSSMQAVEAFAGPTPDVAVVEPEAQAVLLDYDHTVQHYEIAGSSSLPLSS